MAEMQGILKTQGVEAMINKTITLTPELLAEVKAGGKQNERTVSQEIRYQLERIYFKERGKKITA